MGLMASIAAPARIARLVMVCPSRCFFNVPGYDGGFEHCDFRNSSPKWTATISAGQTNLAIGPSAGSDMAQAVAHRFCSTDPLTAGVFAKATCPSDYSDPLDRTVHPTLII